VVYRKTVFVILAGSIVGGWNAEREREREREKERAASD
jgi:hypothetical protein